MAKPILTASKFRYHWVMCSHMPKRQHSTKNPIDTEAVQWIAKNASCSPADALLILNSCLKNKVIIYTGKGYEGSWQSTLAASAHIWGKHVKPLNSSDAALALPDGVFPFTVESAEELKYGSGGSYTRLSLSVKSHGRIFHETMSIIDEDDARAFMESTGHESSEEFNLDTDVTGWEGWVEMADATSEPMLSFCREP